MTDLTRMKRLIHVGCRALGIDAETRHDLQYQATGKESLSDMSRAEMLKVVGVLEQKGFTPGLGIRRRPAAPRADLRLIHVLWRKLGAAGALRTPSRAGLNAFIRKRFGNAWGSVPADIDMLRDWVQIDAVIQALLQWCDREGVALDREKLGR